MTVYTDETLTDHYVDDDGESEFVSSDGETIIIVGASLPEPPAPSGWFIKIAIAFATLFT